jgi:hypothetical protein
MKETIQSQLNGFMSVLTLKNQIKFDLRLFDGSTVSVAHGTNVLAVGSLLVALLEELLHDEVDPTPIKLQRFGWVGQISTVHHVLKNLKEQKKT